MTPPEALERLRAELALCRRFLDFFEREDPDFLTVPPREAKRMAQKEQELADALRAATGAW